VATDESVALYRRFVELAESCGPFAFALSKSAITLKGSRRPADESPVAGPSVRAC